MNTAPPVIAQFGVSAAPPPVVKPERESRAAWLNALIFVWQSYVGLLMCLSILGGVILLGWTYRLMQRAVLKQWWQRSAARRSGLSFVDFLDGSEATREHRRGPNWFLQQNAREAIQAAQGSGPARTIWVWLKAAVNSYWVNLKIGLQGIANIWVLTMPAGLLWLFSWYDGWNNSFNKGHEQYYVGMIIGWIGILLFIAAMFYVPMAQARQAVTGDWRSFYEFQLVWELIRRRWLACVGLAGLTVALSAPLMVLRVAPAFFAQGDPSWMGLTREQVTVALNGYYFWAALAVFPSFVLLRWLAALVYGSAILQAVQSGAVPAEALAESEWKTLHRLDLLHVKPAPARPFFLRFVAWAGTRAGRWTAGAATAFIWFLLVAQIYTGQFFNYDHLAFLNQPMVQLPWFRFVPGAFWIEVGYSLASLGLIWLFRLALQRFRAFRRH